MALNKSDVAPKRKNQTGSILWFVFALLTAALGATENKTIVFFGDSLTAGYGLDPDEAFPSLIQKKIEAAGRHDQVVNAGLSGETTAGGLRRLNWILKQKMDVFVVELGANDGLRGISPDDSRANLQAIINRVREKYPQAAIVIAGMKLPTNLGPEHTARFAAIYPELAATNHVALIPFLLADVGGIPALNQADGIHPTAKGHQIVADNVWAVLKPLL